MKTRTYPYYCDPSHGWLKVPKKKLVELGIENDISKFSYMKGEYAYLEEDDDASLFINKSFEKNGVSVFGKESHSNKRSRIRGYDRYAVLTSEEETRYSKIRSKVLDLKNWNRKAIRSIINATREDLDYWNEFYSLDI